MQDIPAVNNKAYVRDAEFVKLTIPMHPTGFDVYTFSSAYKAETIDGQVFTPLGGYLSVATIQHDLRVTSFDMALSLSGIGAQNIALVLANQIKGSTVEVYRGFYDDNYILQSTVKRYTGVVTSYNITEDREDITDTFTVSIACSSYKTILENKVSGRKTNPRSWNEYAGSYNDSSMTNVPALDKAYWDFGMKVTATGGGSAAATEQQQTITDSTNR